MHPSSLKLHRIFILLSWSIWGCPFLLQRGWTTWPLNVPSSPNYSMTLPEQFLGAFVSIMKFLCIRENQKRSIYSLYFNSGFAETWENSLLNIYRIDCLAVNHMPVKLSDNSISEAAKKFVLKQHFVQSVVGNLKSVFPRSYFKREIFSPPPKFMTVSNNSKVQQLLEKFEKKNWQLRRKTFWNKLRSPH